MKYEDDQEIAAELMARAAQLPAAVAPERDLWPAVEQVITAARQPGRSAWNTVWAQAAAVVLLVGGSSGLTYMAMSDKVDPTTPVVATPMLIFEPVSGSFGSSYNLGPDYLDARRELAGELDDELAKLSPQTRAEVKANIETIQKAIDDINKALDREPDNVLLQELLLDTYRDELDLMMKVDGIGNSAMRRGDI